MALIELTGIRRTFGAYVALHELTLTLPAGRIGLLGPNGAGKSTLLKLILGLIPPTAGRGTVLGQPLGGDQDAANNWQLRRLIGFMPEAESLVPGLTGLEYVGLAGELCGMPRQQAQRRAHEVLGYLQLEEARYRRVEEYSAGMKQRVKLAQALIHDPPLLLLDEPTSGLDPAGRDAMLKLLIELGRDHGKSMILSTHLLADVQTVCEHVVIIAGGKLRGQGTVQELCASRKNRFRLKFAPIAEGSFALAEFDEALKDTGVEFTAEGPTTERRIVVPEGWSNRMLFRLAQTHGVSIRAITPDDETLEELFLRTIHEAA